MFAKTAVLFFAFFAFVNAAPILPDELDLGLGEGPANPWKPIYGVGPVQLPTPSAVSSSKRAIPLELGPGLGPKGLNVHVRGTMESAGINYAPIVNGPGASVSRIKRGLVGLIPTTAHVFDNTIPPETDAVYVNGQIDVVAGVESRDIVIDSQTLAQLESFVNAIVNALQVTGNTQAVNTFLTQVNNLKVEVENGTLDVADLLSAAQAIVLSII